jgi:hypothetical protein
MASDGNDHETAEALASSEDSAAAPPATLLAPPVTAVPAVSETAAPTVVPTVDQMVDAWFNTEFRESRIVRDTEDWNFMRGAVSRLKDLLAGL